MVKDDLWISGKETKGIRKNTTRWKTQKKKMIIYKSEERKGTRENQPGNKTLEHLVMPADKLNKVRRCHSGGRQKQEQRPGQQQLKTKQ